MVSRVTVALEQPEYSALVAMAMAELRNPADQLHHILREELEERGLLPAQREAVGSQTERGTRLCRADLLDELSQHAVVETRVITTQDGTTYHVVLISPRGAVQPQNDEHKEE
jgi:hypothetical protein